MRTNKFLVMSMLVTALLCSCSNEEEPATAGQGEAMQVSAGIGEATRAVIDAGYGSDLAVSFARLDNPESNTDWTTPAIDATRLGGGGNTSVTFATAQTYMAANGQSTLIGYYPQAALSGKNNPTVSYTITGDEDIMATEVQTGAANAKFTPFTFQHLLTQLQFKCSGSAEAVKKWTKVSSITVKNVYNTLSLSLDKTSGATLATTGSANTSLSVIGCPEEVSGPDATDPKTGYLMIYPVADMGTESAAINLEVKATYNGAEKTLQVPITNISGGAQKGQSHLITLNFTIDGEITIEAGIAEWQPGNGGSSTITPGA
ncbi:fimbrillin family protein [Parabacteroides timonensis]|uniref:fimbrillin family protein n=1 Tax=Parabacteroides timonensis TaxID=1871013 RepID=UPI00094F2F5B|nr:fimbrillin family protein [Parabacteroides timonensis]